MTISKNRSMDWLNQAKNDLDWAKDSSKAGHYAQSCFVAQQVGEKALKAIAYFRGAVIVQGHSITKIAKDLGINGKVESAAKKLDLYYITARYPDAFPMGYPSEFISEEQSIEAIQLAKNVLEAASKELE